MPTAGKEALAKVLRKVGYCGRIYTHDWCRGGCRGGRAVRVVAWPDQEERRLALRIAARGFLLPGAEGAGRGIYHPHRKKKRIRREAARMAERVPEAWIGSEVLIHVADALEFVVTLEDVRDFGIVYTREGSDELLFSPWSSIRWMRLPGADAAFFSAGG